MAQGPKEQTASGKGLLINYIIFLGGCQTPIHPIFHVIYKYITSVSMAICIYINIYNFLFCYIYMHIYSMASGHPILNNIFVNLQCVIINRPGEAGAVLLTASSFIDLFSQSVSLFLQIFIISTALHRTTLHCTAF